MSDTATPGLRRRLSSGLLLGFGLAKQQDQNELLSLRRVGASTLLTVLDSEKITLASCHPNRVFLKLVSIAKKVICFTEPECYVKPSCEVTYTFFEKSKIFTSSSMIFRKKKNKNQRKKVTCSLLLTNGELAFKTTSSRNLFNDPVFLLPTMNLSFLISIQFFKIKKKNQVYIIKLLSLLPTTSTDEKDEETLPDLAQIDLKFKSEEEMEQMLENLLSHLSFMSDYLDAIICNNEDLNLKMISLLRLKIDLDVLVWGQQSSKARKEVKKLVEVLKRNEMWEEAMFWNNENEKRKRQETEKEQLQLLERIRNKVSEKREQGRKPDL